MTSLNKKSFYRKVSFACMALMIGLLLNHTSNAQAINTNSGTDFWFGYTETDDGTSASYVVYINTLKTTSGTVSIPGYGWSTTFTVVPTATTRIVLPSADVVVTSFTGPTNQSVNVVADSNISVFAAIEYSERSDNSCILPVSNLGNQYYIMDLTLCQSFSNFMIIAQGCKDSVEIIPSQNIIVGGSHLAGVPYTEVLNPGQVYLVQSDNDLTGSVVMSLNHSETGVIAGANWNCVFCSGTANPFYEEILPNNTWGQNFVFLPTAQAQDQCRVLSEQNGTVVTFNTASGPNIQTLNAGQYYDTTVNYSSPVFISGSNPIEVGRFLRTGGCNNYYITNPTGKGDPSQVYVDANEQMFLDTIAFYVSRTPDIDSTYIQVVTRTADKNKVYLDGVNIGAFFTTLIPNPTYAFTSLTILPGSHTLTTTGQGFVAYTCGLGYEDAMACDAGVYLKEINITTSVTQPSTCSASDGTATATVTGIPPFIYTWSNGETTSTATGLSAGIYTVTVTDSDCVPHKASAIVTISGRAGYSASVTDTNPNCSNPLGKSTVFPTGGIAPYTYNWNNGETTQTATGLSAGSYTCTITDNTGCKYIATTTIVNQPPPAIGIAPYNDSSCGPPNEVLTAYGLNTGVYHWAPNTGLSCYTCANPTATPTVTTTYTISGVDSNGCNASTTITLTVLSAPIAIIHGKDSICAGYEDTLYATGGNTYVWSPGGATTDSIFGAPATTKTFTVQASNGYCPSHDTTFTVHVVSPAAAITQSKDSICAGDSVHLTAAGGLTYKWNTGSTSTSIWVKPIATTTYTLHATIPGCSDSATAKVKIIPKITATISATKDSICKHGTTTITATGVGGQVTYKWNTGATTSSITVTDSVPTKYIATVYGICDSVKDTIVINILPGISPVLTGTLTECRGANDVLTISGGNTYKWNTGATTSSITVSDTATTTYTATAYGVCDTVKKMITVTIIQPPVAAIAGTSSKCTGFTDTLTASGGTRYLWSNGSTSTNYFTGPINADSTITLIAYNSFGCSDTTHYKITLNPAPTFTINPNTVACSGDQVLLKATPTNGGPFSYLWTPGGQTSDTVTVNPDSATVYTVVVSNGCVVTKTTEVIPDRPVLTACCDKVILLGDDTTIIASGTRAQQYQWSPSVDCLNPLCDFVKVSPTITTTYTVTYTDSAGCQREQLVTIIVEDACANFTVPNVFTPNNSGPLGENNIFYIKTQNLNTWSLLIYDRWGKEMYSSSNSNQYWNGTAKDGGEAPAGVYYYIIDATCQGNTYKKDGFVQLIR